MLGAAAHHGQKPAEFIVLVLIYIISLCLASLRSSEINTCYLLLYTSETDAIVKGKRTLLAAVYLILIQFYSEYQGYILVEICGVHMEHHKNNLAIPTQK